MRYPFNPIGWCLESGKQEVSPLPSGDETITIMYINILETNEKNKQTKVSIKKYKVLDKK